MNKDYVCKECGNNFTIQNDPSLEMNVDTSHMSLETFYNDDTKILGVILHHRRGRDCCMRMYSQEDIDKGKWGQFCMFKDCASYDTAKDFNIGLQDPDFFYKMHGHEPILRTIKIDPIRLRTTSNEDLEKLGDVEKILTEVLAEGIKSRTVRDSLINMEKNIPQSLYEKEDEIWELMECATSLGDQMEVNQYFAMKELWCKAVGMILDEKEDFYKINLSFAQYSYSIRLVGYSEKLFVDIYHPTFGLHMAKFAVKIKDKELDGVAILSEELFFRGGNGNVLMAKAKAMLLCGELIRMLVDIIKNKKGEA